MSGGTEPGAKSGSKVAFVLGGGGHMGAYEVGMLGALLGHGIRPDLVVGASIGAINGAALAAEPTPAMVRRLEQVWTSLDEERIFGDSLFSGAANLVRSRTHLHSNAPLRRLLERTLPVKTFEELQVPFRCVAASVERAAEHWFSEGPLIPAILASAAVPGVLPMVEIDGEHFLDGGIVNSIPIEGAVNEGATDIYVLHVGRVERALEPPRNPWQVAMVAFEIARRHRFAHDMASLPKGVVAHLLPTGEERVPAEARSQFKYRDFSDAAARIARARRATSAYLEGGQP